jgi:uncharacterized protein DUF6308
VAAEYTEAEWRRRWPAVIVDCDTDGALPLLRSYYGVRRNGTPRYTGAHFEKVAALNDDPNSLGPADFVAVSLLSVNVPKEAVIRLLADESAAEITRHLRAIPADVTIVDADPTPSPATPQQDNCGNSCGLTETVSGQPPQASCSPPKGPNSFRFGTASSSKPPDLTRRTIGENFSRS